MFPFPSEHKMYYRPQKDSKTLRGGYSLNSDVKRPNSNMLYIHATIQKLEFCIITFRMLQNYFSNKFWHKAANCFFSKFLNKKCWTQNQYIRVISEGSRDTQDCFAMTLQQITFIKYIWILAFEWYTHTHTHTHYFSLLHYLKNDGMKLNIYWFPKLFFVKTIKCNDLLCRHTNVGKLSSFEGLSRQIFDICT